MTPNGVKDFVRAGHKVIVEAGAGVGSGFSDKEYKAAGAELAPVKEVFAKADMIYKVKEPLPQEWPMFKPGQILYTYLHLAAAYAKDLTKGMLKADIRGIAFETVELPNGAHPLLFPMSEVAGKMAVQAGATHLQKENGGRGVLIGGVTGVPRRRSSSSAAAPWAPTRRRSPSAWAHAPSSWTATPRASPTSTTSSAAASRPSSAPRRPSSRRSPTPTSSSAPSCSRAARRPRTSSRSACSRHMMPGSVLVDVAIDQGGCFETSKPTSHTEPTYVVDGVIHYCVANMPGADGPHLHGGPRRRDAALRPRHRQQGPRARPSRKTPPSRWASTCTVAS